ncbi:hypothetical protein SAMN02982989_1671 [Xaviernesmea oryzae]|uniref:Uncharacterized protein n=1 Tax=Xaviernesmea oryzae TaxID=464029 RepID=A0A1X7ERX5_9HYPH|nr:hypothetical protein [Xaviernesmea oryzae]SMF38788.1 hypothetical protein SAMN02982989_1671 [Xaviernesmea oryzae]
MNKIVREHYPVANLPEDLREGLEKDATVRVVIEEQPPEQARPSGFLESEYIASLPKTPLTREELRKMIQRIRAQDRPSVSTEEAVARIRELRDEWDY